MKNSKDIVAGASSQRALGLCPNCRAPIIAGNKFCMECGTKLEGVISTKEPLAPGSTSSPSNIAVSSSATSSQQLPLRASRSGQSPVADMLAHYQVSQSLREMYFDLGIALSQHQEYARANEAFQQALVESGVRPETVDILFYLAYVSELGGQRERAFRTYLEALLQAPDWINTVLLYMHELLTLEIAVTQNQWITEKWLPRMLEGDLSALNRMHMSILIGRIHLCLANYARAQEFFNEARQLVPDVVPTMVGEILAPEILPPALAAPEKDGNTHYLLAQLYFSLGSPQLSLEEVELALGLGLTGESRYPDGPAHELKGRLLEALGKQEEAALCYYEAGRNFYWSNDLVSAEVQFSHAAQRHLDYTPTYWYWSDSLFRRSFVTELPNVDEAIIEESLKVWETGYELERPDATYSWAYSTRASICEQFARLPNAAQWNLWWEAIIYLERSLLLSRQDANCWSYLARYHRYLSTELNALAATGVALEYDPENPFILDERAAILANLGDFAAAEAAIDKRLVLEENDWARTVKAYIALYTGRYEEALELLNGLLEKAPLDMWIHELRAYCYRKLGLQSLSEADYRWIWERYKENDSGNLSIYALAAYRLGSIKQAIEILDTLRDDPGQDPGSVLNNLGLCYLTLGELARGKSHLHKGIGKIASLQRLKDVEEDLDDIEKSSVDWPHGDQVRPILLRLREKIKRRHTQIAQPLTVEDELKLVSKKYPRQGKSGSWAWIGAQAGLARFYAEEQREVEAAQLYQLLLKESVLFPEARIGLEKMVDALQAKGDTRLKKHEHALEEYTQALVFVQRSLPDDRERQCNLYLRLSLAYCDLADFAEARISLARAIQLSRKNNISAPGEKMGVACQALLRGAAHYWTLDAEWKTWADDPAAGKRLQTELTAARRALASYLDELFQLSEQYIDNADLLPTVTPVVLEIGQGLIPADTSDKWSLFKSYIPAMRQRFQDEMGVNVSGVRVRGSNILAPEGYLIMLDEAEIERSTVYLDMRYCLVPPETVQALGIPKTAFIEKPHPVTGEPGCWISRDSWELIASNNLELWAEPLVFIIHHLEDAMLRNLTNFMGTQDVENLLTEWRKSQDAAALIASALPDEHAKYYFAQLLRALVKEQVPITSWKDILETFREAGLINVDVSEAVRLIRLRLKEHLPGNNPNAQRLELPIGWEDLLISGLEHKNGRTFLTLPPEETYRFLSTIRSAVKARDWNLVLVTRNSEIRPFVRRLVETEFPHLMILAQEELVAVDQVVGMEQTKGVVTNAQ